MGLQNMARLQVVDCITFHLFHSPFLEIEQNQAICVSFHLFWLKDSQPKSDTLTIASIDGLMEISKSTRSAKSSLPGVDTDYCSVHLVHLGGECVVEVPRAATAPTKVTERHKSHEVCWP